VTSLPSHLSARQVRLNEIQRTRLGGVDRITLDQDDDEPIARYAHVLRNSLTTTVHTTDDPHEPDDAYDASWTLVGVIDLDTGEVVEDA
jgi:hypothetical protein